MPVLYLADLKHILIVVLIYMLFMNVYRILMPYKYFSIQQLIYEGDVAKTRVSSAIRTLIIISLSMIFYHFLKYSEVQIKMGILIGSFLIVWPAIVQYKLFYFYKNGRKASYLTGYMVFIIFSGIIARMTIRYVYPMIFEGKEFILVSNDGIAVLYTLISYAFPTIFDGIVSKNTSVRIYEDIDTFWEDLEIIRYQLDLEYYRIDAYYYEILAAAEENNINVNLLKSILTLEYINRGQWYNRLSEIILCKCFPSIAIKRDISVGLAQIRISTAQDVLQQSPFIFLKQLTNVEFNISVCAKYLRKLKNEYDALDDFWWEDYNDLYTYIATEFVGATRFSRSKTIPIYSAIMRNQCEEGFGYIPEKAD